MAALRDIARDFAAEIRDGIGWTIVYRTGRSRHPEIDYYDNDYLVLLTADTVRETEFSDLTHALCDLTVARAQ